MYIIQNHIRIFFNNIDIYYTYIYIICKSIFKIQTNNDRDKNKSTVTHKEYKNLRDSVICLHSNAATAYQEKLVSLKKKNEISIMAQKFSQKP